MRYAFLTSVAFAALIAAAPASFAFEVQHTTSGSGAAANFANNPDNASDSMSANLAGDSSGSPILHFGSSSLQFSGGGSSYAPTPAYQEQFMGGPGQIGNAISPR